MPEPVEGLFHSSLYLNRELSLLEFQARVLEQAKDPSTPLLERLRFLTICGTNLDEFFEIRASGLKQQVALGLPRVEPDGMSAEETLRRISERAHALVAEQYRLLNEVLLPELEEEGVYLPKRAAWTVRQQRWIKRFFESEVLPVLTPVGLDPAHPFPRVVNKSLNFIVSVEGKDAYERTSGIAVVPVPRSLPRLIPLPSGAREGDPRGGTFVLLSSIVHAHIDALFPGMEVKGCAQFRVTRNSDLWVDEEEVDDLMRALKGELSSRNFGDAVRLEVADTCTEEMARYLLETFELADADLYKVNGPVNLNRLVALHTSVERPDLKYAPFVPRSQRPVEESADMFAAIGKGDILLHHPYDSFGPVLELLRQAAADPNVLAIKQTLYRTGADSPVVEALLEAARAGKEVSVVIELLARFDEASNIQLATRLQQAGASVAYGVVGYKTHAKMLLIVRREAGRLRRYVHLGSGNYHAGTMRQYTDVSLLTCQRDFGEDVHNLFLQLTGLGRAARLRKLLQAPFALERALIAAIDREARHAAEGRKGRIVARMNSLSDPRVIRALYRASRAGVEIDLIVRGLCCLRPGVPGVSERIRVRSIVGRLLEHSRVLYFHDDGRERLWCSSADWMPRNFHRRIETCFPVEDPRLAARLREEALELYLADNVRAWSLRPDGSYERLRPGTDEPVAAQEVLLARLCGMAVEGRPAPLRLKEGQGGPFMPELLADESQRALPS